MKELIKKVAGKIVAADQSPGTAPMMKQGRIMVDNGDGTYDVLMDSGTLQSIKFINTPPVVDDSVWVAMLGQGRVVGLGAQNPSHAFDTWSPVLQQSTTTVTTTIEEATFREDDRLVICHTTLKCLSTGATSYPKISLPFPHKGVPAGFGYRRCGNGWIRLNVGGVYYEVSAWLGSDTSIVSLSPIQTDSTYAYSSAWTTALLNNDYVDVDFWYERAA